MYDKQQSTLPLASLETSSIGPAWQASQLQSTLHLPFLIKCMSMATIFCIWIDPQYPESQRLLQSATFMPSRYKNFLLLQMYNYSTACCMCIANAVEYKWFHSHQLVISKLQLTLASAVASAVVPVHGCACEHVENNQCMSMNIHNNVN